MAQKAHPTILRPTYSLYTGSTYWDEPKFYYITSTIHKLIESCCLGTNNYLNKIHINRHLGLIIIEIDLIHLHFRSKGRFVSRRYKENKLKIKKQSWTVVASRLYIALKLIQKLSGTKKVTLKINRLKAYTRSIPKPARRQLIYFNKGFNRTKYDFARYGMQLIYLILKGKASALTFSRFLTQNICSRQKRKRHYQFLAFIKQALKALEPYKKIKGLKIQIKGRFTHKAKGRSRSWKHQIGSMPLSQLNKSIQAQYTQTQTAYGSVGIKVWICS
uniref:Ribosomal protein S3 n=1 Tax=Colpomenia peregrina TaxID=27965 RepID=A0A0U1V7S3_9PHAE|nr:ribosomal protein S3 [Colpomenia peregrina]AIR12177.1 ribosomal protein S3 [Colpomenia peregrina]WVH38382.1 ribosomal protein S3 [Colpomenia sinuosa]